MNPVLALAEQWRANGALLRRYGNEQGATVCELHSQELEAKWRAWQGEELTIAQAATESGYSEEHIRRQIRQGKIPNAGRCNAPRIRRQDLPRKPGRWDVPGPLRMLDCMEQIARSVADSTEGERDG